MTDSAPVIDGARPICLACIHDHTHTAAQRNRRDQVRAGAASELQGKPRNWQARRPQLLLPWRPDKPVSLLSRLAASPRKRRCFALMHTVKPATSALCCTSKRKFLAGHVTRSLVSPQPTSHRYMYSQWQCKVATDAVLMLLHHIQILMSGLRLDQPQLTLSCSLVSHSNGSTNL